MSSYPPPIYFFNGIIFNDAYFIASSTGSTSSGVSQSYVDNTFLKKAGDVATGLISFLGGTTTETSSDFTTTPFITWNPTNSNYIINDSTVSTVGAATRCTVIGHTAGDALTDGSFNTFYGYNAGTSTDVGESNTFIGRGAGRANTNGINNTYIGDQAGLNATGKNNTIIGAFCDTGGFDNTTLLGVGATASASNQVVLGSVNQTVILPNLTSSGNGFVNPDVTLRNYFYVDRTTRPSGADNICVGYFSGNGITTGNNNICIGSNSGKSITTQFNNVFIGTAVGQNCITSYNCGVGYNALASLTTGNYNNALGWGALQNVTTGAGNTSNGNNANVFLTTGSNNTAIGYNANNNVVNTTLSNSTAIGANTSNANFSSSTAIGYNAVNTANNQIMLGTSAENVNILGGLVVGKAITTSVTSAPTSGQIGNIILPSITWTTNINSTPANIATFTIDGTTIKFGVYNCRILLGIVNGATAGDIYASISTTSVTFAVPMTILYFPVSTQQTMSINWTISAYASTTYYIVCNTAIGTTATINTVGANASAIQLTRIA